MSESELDAMKEEARSKRLAKRLKQVQNQAFDLNLVLVWYTEKFFCFINIWKYLTKRNINS